MKITAALAILATVSQGLLTLAAPSKPTTDTLPFKMPKKINYDDYYRAIMKANNLTTTDFAPTRAAYEASRDGEVSTRAAGHAPSTMFCVGWATTPVRMRIFPDVHGCSQAGWTSLYAFISYTTKEDALATKPWVACQSHYSGHVLLFQESCPSYMAQGAKGYANSRDTGSQSFVQTAMANGEGYMYTQPIAKQPDFQSDGNKFTLKGTIRHLATFTFPDQNEVNSMTKHVYDHPHLYKRIVPFHTFIRTIANAAQYFVNSLGDLNTRRTDLEREVHSGAGFDTDLRQRGWQHLAGRFRIVIERARQATDNAFRHNTGLYYQADDGEWQWMGGVSLPSDYFFNAGTIHAAFSEAVRDHTNVRVERSSHGGWLLLPLPPYVNGPLPPIPPIYGSGGFIR